MMSPMTAVMVFMFYASPSINSLMEEGPLNARTTITMTRMSNMWERPPCVRAMFCTSPCSVKVVTEHQCLLIGI